MSMVDETPSHFVKEGYIYKHTPANHYRSAGFTCGTDAYDTKICEATPRNINKYYQKNGLYSYDEHKWLAPITSDYRDAFDNPIFKGDKVLFMDCYYDGGFCGYMQGVVTGFTKEYVKIRPTKHDRLDSCSDWGRYEWIRKPYRVVILNEE